MRNYLEPRRLVGYAIVFILVAVLAVQYVLAIKPAARRERLSNCGALQPTPFNPVLGKFPRLAPDATFTDFQGNQVKLSAYRGHVVLLNFWADWCPPCVDEVPSIQKLQAALGKDGLTILAAASESDWAPIRKFFPNGTNLSVVLDPPKQGDSVGATAQKWGTEQIPETYVIDKKGTIRYYIVNKRDWASHQAVECVRSLLDEG